MELREHIRNTISTLAGDYDTFYLYDEKGIIDRINMLKSNFPCVDFIYSAKCNPNRGIVKAIVSQGLGVDAASVRECLLAGECGVEKGNIFYSAPGKTEDDVRSGLNNAVLIADSIGELERIEQIVEHDRKQGESEAVNAGIRINPGFNFEGNSGVPSKFGIDEEDVFKIKAENCFEHIRINGIHVHLKSQILSAELMLDYYDRVLELAVRIEAVFGYQLEYINLGSGLGIPYSNEDNEIDIEWLGRRFTDRIAKFKESHLDTHIIIETGRFVVGPNGYYVTHVVDCKISHGVKYIVLQSTLNGFLRPSLARLVEKYAKISGRIDRRTLAGTEPLYSGGTESEILTLVEDGEREMVTVVGNLCTGADVVAENIELPKLDVGDVVILPNAGAYGAVISPMQFASMEKPEELIYNS